MLTNALCPTCGKQIVVVTPDTNTDLKEEKSIVKCEQCSHYIEVLIGPEGLRLTPVDEIGVVVKGLRTVARMIEDGEVTLVRSRHGFVKMPGRGKQQPTTTDIRALEVMYR